MTEHRDAMEMGYEGEHPTPNEVETETTVRVQPVATPAPVERVEVPQEDEEKPPNPIRIVLTNIAERLKNDAEVLSQLGISRRVLKPLVDVADIVEEALIPDEAELLGRLKDRQGTKSKS